MTRFVAILAILVASVCTTAMNWRFSYQLGTSAWDSYTWAIFSVALDVTKWLMLPFATLAWRNHKLRSLAAFAIWLVATIYSFAAAIGFAALNRETSVISRFAGLERRRVEFSGEQGSLKEIHHVIGAHRCCSWATSAAARPRRT